MVNIKNVKVIDVRYIGVQVSLGVQGVCLTVARGECISSRASGTPVTTSPAGEWSWYPIYNDGYSIIMFTNFTAHVKERKQVMLFSTN